MDAAATFPPLEIDPRKVQRLAAYLVRHARLHSNDPLEHQRRYLAGLRFQMRLRCRPSRFDPPRAAAAVFSLSDARQRATHRR